MPDEEYKPTAKVMDGVLQAANLGMVTPPDLAEFNPQQLLMKALEVNPSPEVLEKMMELEDRWRATMARRAFVAAMAKFKTECPSVIAKTASAAFKTNKGQAVEYKWTPLEVLVEIVTPHLSRNGLSIGWAEEQSDKGMVRCIFTVRHELGHSESNALAAPRQDNHLLSPAQNLAAAVTSLRRYTFLGGLGLATAEMADEEGSSKQRGKNPRPTKEQIAALRSLAKDEMLSPENQQRAAQVAMWAERGQRIDAQKVIDELTALCEPPSAVTGSRAGPGMAFRRGEKEPGANG